MDGVTGTTEAMQTCGAIERRSSCVVVQWRLTIVGHLLADVGHLGAPPRTRPARCCAGRKIATRRAPRRQARHAVRVSPAMPSIVHRHPPGAPVRAPSPSTAELQHLGLDLGVSGVGLTARRLPPLAPQVSQVGNSALVEWEAVTLRLDHASGFELADVSSAAIEVLRQCRRADGRGLSGSRARDRLDDGGRPMVTGSVIAFVPVASR